jgi:hypothetical protein
MPITLPDKPIPAVSDLTGNNILIVGDYGVGKSGLLASTSTGGSDVPLSERYILLDPQDKLRAYPDLLRVTVKSWPEHKEFLNLLAKVKPGTYAGIGLDVLNISYDQCLLWCMKNIKFAGSFLSHPSENPQIAYPRVTIEFISWVRDITLLGFHVIASCHVNLAPIRDKKGNAYDRWIPGFVGGSPNSTYSEILKIFPIVGFMAVDSVEKQAISPAAKRLVMGKMVPDTRSDASRLDETEMAHVIYFKQDPLFLANNKFGGFPDRVVLTENWQDDWRLLQEAWGSGDKHEIMDEEEEPELTIPPTAVPAGTTAMGLAVKK